MMDNFKLNNLDLSKVESKKKDVVFLVVQKRNLFDFTCHIGQEKGYFYIKLSLFLFVYFQVTLKDAV